MDIVTLYTGDRFRRKPHSLLPVDPSCSFEWVLLQTLRSDNRINGVGKTVVSGCGRRVDRINEGWSRPLGPLWEEELVNQFPGLRRHQLEFDERYVWD